VPHNSRPQPIRNHLLAALPGEDYKSLLSHLEYVPLPFMEVSYESGEAAQADEQPSPFNFQKEYARNAAYRC
jgi:hypothetical protein